MSKKKNRYLISPLFTVVFLAAFFVAMFVKGGVLGTHGYTLFAMLLFVSFHYGKLLQEMRFLYRIVTLFIWSVLTFMQILKLKDEYFYSFVVFLFVFVVIVVFVAIDLIKYGKRGKNRQKRRQ